MNAAMILCKDFYIHVCWFWWLSETCKAQEFLSRKFLVFETQKHGNLVVSTSRKVAEIEKPHRDPAKMKITHSPKEGPAICVVDEPGLQGRRCHEIPRPRQ